MGVLTMALFGGPDPGFTAELKRRLAQTKEIMRPGHWQEYEDGSREWIPPVSLKPGEFKDGLGAAKGAERRLIEEEGYTEGLGYRKDGTPRGSLRLNVGRSSNVEDRRGPSASAGMDSAIRVGERVAGGENDVRVDLPREPSIMDLLRLHFLGARR